jgi:hypothetical protein
VSLEADLGGEAPNGVLEPEVDGVMEIFALRRSGLNALPVSAEEIREEVFDPARAREVKSTEVESAARPRSGPPARLMPRAEDLVSELVVLLTLGRVAQDLVRFGDLLELRLGRLIVGVDVRMVFPGQAAIGLLDLFLRGALADAQGLVVVPLIHARLLG